jgi:hypothetical protein
VQIIRQHIKISDIDLDLENFRIDASDTQEETFENMLEDQKHQLVNLAEDILKHGLSPVEQLIVVAHPTESGKYVVCEGNRRITALKFLSNPSKVPDPDFVGTFERLAADFRKRPLEEVECVIFQDKKSALHWIDRKHQTLDGRGLNQWGAVANGRRVEYLTGQLRPSKIVLNYLESVGALTPDLAKSVRKRTTNLDRVFQMPYLKDRLGIIVNRRNGDIKFSDISEKKGAQILLLMVENLADKDFPVRLILERVQRVNFIDQFAYLISQPDTPEPVAPQPEGSTTQKPLTNDGKPVSDEGLQQPLNPTNQGTAKPNYPKIKDTLSRNTLALTQAQHTLSIKDNRIARIYREARRIDPGDFTNASSLLLRVFLELSVDHYLEEKNFPLPKKHLQNGRKRWSDIGINLQEKVQTVLDDLDPTKRDPDLKMARKGLNGDMGHSIGSLHDLIHNRLCEQSDRELKQAWERWQPFWKRLYSAL